MNPRPLKLALVTRRYPPLIGGAEKVFSYLAAALAAEGADVTVVTSQMPGLKLARGRGSGHHARDEDNVERISLVRPAEGCAVWRPHGCVSGERGATCRTSRSWFQQNPVDLAYVSMLKHDAYSVIGAGEAVGFSGRASA